jgi:hypothetical protein
MLLWAREHTDPEQWDAVEAELFAPFEEKSRDPDVVPQNVIDEEMSLFNGLTRQNDALGGL